MYRAFSSSVAARRAPTAFSRKIKRTREKPWPKAKVYTENAILEAPVDPSLAKNAPNNDASAQVPEVLAKLRQQDPVFQIEPHSIDVSHPWRLYPNARKLQRKVFLHIGPTNSGKSYTALKSFRNAKSGFYAGPLRMLAREVYDRLETEGIPCNLVTGDEILEKVDPKTGKLATLNAGTVEMVDTVNELDVAVIDEIQIINDPDRGWAWTKAFLGVKAREIHLCGDANSEKVIRELISQTGDELHVKHYTRLSPLAIDKRNITPETLIKSLEPGDCIICFSKREVKAMRDKIVQAKKKPCAIIYGSLPPETRAEQARLFNDPSNKVDYLVASDAIGMGLNLAIRRVIFTTLTKFDGERMAVLEVPQIKQMAGRAGRFKLADSSDGGEGLVNCLSKRDKDLVKQALAKDSPEIKSAVYLPPIEVINASSINKSQMFSQTLQTVYQGALVGPGYTRPREGNAVSIAQLYDGVHGLTFTDKLVLANAPVSNTPECHSAFVRFCETIGSGRCRNVMQIIPLVRDLANPKPGIIKLETIHKVLTLFLWLSYRFPCNFDDREGATDLRDLCEEKLNEELKSSKNLAGKTTRSHRRR